METQNPDILRAREMLLALRNQQNEVTSKLGMLLSSFPMLSDNDKKQLGMLLDTMVAEAQMTNNVLVQAQQGTKAFIPQQSQQRSARG